MGRQRHLLLRRLRGAGLVLLEPLDYAGRLINGKRSYPPLRLRRHAGPLEPFERTAGEYVGYLSTLAGLNSQSNVLDVGCGPGTLALVGGLRERFAGRYVGFDVDRRTVEWANTNLADDHFSFAHYNYWNATYNPKGERFLPWPVSDGWADIVVLKSVLTHLLPDDVGHFLGEIRRVLSGTALVSAFCYDRVDEPVEKAFPHVGPGYRYIRKGSPESGIAYERAYLESEIERVGLRATYLPGFWRGAGSAYQDLFVATAR